MSYHKWMNRKPYPTDLTDEQWQRLAPYLPRPRSGGPNDAVNVAVIGLGSTTAVGGVGGRGHQLIGRLHETPGVKIVALCDADQALTPAEFATLMGQLGAIARAIGRDI